jgi:hypothetical protein
VYLPIPLTKYMLLTGCLGTLEECNLKFLKNTKNNQRPPRGSPAKTLAVLINTAEHRN